MREDGAEKREAFRHSLRHPAPMPEYCRNRVLGAICFFTINLFGLVVTFVPKMPI